MTNSRTELISRDSPLVGSGPQRDTGLYTRLKALIIARLIVGSTLLLGAALPLELSGSHSASKFLFRFITLILVLTIIYTGMLNRWKNLTVFGHIQLLGDIFLVTICLTATGGIESPFSILYVLIIVIASNLIPRKGTFLTAVYASMFFIAIIIMQYQGFTNWWPSSTLRLLPPPSFAVYLILVNLSGFFLTAILSNHLVERVRRVNILLDNKSIQYNRLLALNERIVNEIPTGLITASIDGGVVSMNPGARRMVTTDPDQKLHLEDMFPSYLVHSILQSSLSPGFVKCDIPFQRRINDVKRWFQIEVIGLTESSDDPARIMLIINDVTDHKRLDEARRKAERWSTVAEISAGMAHEIRNPLASISGSIEVLKEQINLEDRELRLMNIVLRESERLNRLISDFLNFAKPQTPDFGLFDLHPLLEETILLLKNSPEWKSTIQVHKQFCQQKLELEVDCNQFLQISWNIAKNAFESMQNGGELIIETKIQEKPEYTLSESELQKFPPLPYARICFKDTGIGMSTEMIEKIFDPFVTFKQKGIGIGLAIVQRLMENHNGHIRVISEPHQGTSFELRLPMRQNI